MAAEPMRGKITNGLRWHLPDQLKAFLPDRALNFVREIRVRILSRGLATDRTFIQSEEDSRASESMSIVVPIHDSPIPTRRCLASLALYAPRSEVILIDDGSRMSKTVQTIREFGDRNGWKIVTHERARGHSEACAAGASVATRPYICLLNSDTVVTPWCWRPIVAAFKDDSAIGVAGPSTSASGNEQSLEVAMYCRHSWNDSQIYAFAERLALTCPQPTICELPWASGFAFFIRKSLWEQLRGFDEQLPDYGNEVELCKRVASVGYRIVWVRNSYIHHLFQQTYSGRFGQSEIRARSEAAHEYTRKKHAGG